VQPLVNTSSATIGVMSVATNQYLNYWKSMVKSAEAVTSAEDRVTFFVFTDDPAEANAFATEVKNVKIRVFGIESFGWPEATLLRYKIFQSCIKQLDTEILVHLDADMYIVSNPWQRIRNNLENNSVCLVKHPGFWRPGGISRIFLYVLNPLMFYRDSRLAIKVGGLGSWETETKSRAFVTRSLRFQYYCGGTWFGKKESISKLLETLSNRVALDLHENIIARWHDESHINKWAIENSHGTENPELCFDGTYPQLKSLKPVIVAVRKPQTVR